VAVVSGVAERLLVEWRTSQAISVRVTRSSLLFGDPFRFSLWRAEQRRTVIHSTFSSSHSELIGGRWDSAVELEGETIMQVVTLTSPVSPIVSLSSHSLSLSSLFILLSSFFFFFLTTPLTHSRTTTRVCASPPCPPYIHCLGSYGGPEVMRRRMGSLPRDRSTIGMVLVEHPLELRCSQLRGWV
jgi:hypothetical protein